MMTWLKQNWIIIVLVGVLVFFALIFTKDNESPLSKDNGLSLSFEATEQIRRELFHIEDEKITASSAEELSNEQICTNIGYLLVAHCGSGGCFLSQPLEEWIDKAKNILRSRGVTAYEYKDSDIDCSEMVVERVDKIYETTKNSE